MTAMVSIKFLFTVLLLTVFTGSPALASNLIIRDVHVVSPHLDTPMMHANVVIESGRITTVTTTAAASADGGVEIDGGGMYLIPGLMDSHVHTFSVPGFGIGRAPVTPATQKLYAEYHMQQPRSYLFHGVTQLVDLAATPVTVAQFNGATVRPHLVHCGAAPLKSGYPTMFLPTAALNEVFPYHITEQRDSGTSQAVTDEHSPEVVVQRMYEDGASCLKLFMEDGFGEATHWPLMSDEAFRRAINAARQRDMQVVVHANSLSMQQRAMRYDIDVIAHGVWNWDQFKSSHVLPAPIIDHLNEIRSRKIHFQPTIGVVRGLRDLFDDGYLANTLLTQVAPPALIDWYASDDGQWFKTSLIQEEGFGGAADAFVVERFDQIMNKGIDAVAYLAKVGYPLLLASDTPSSPTYANQPGLNSYLELIALHEAGVNLVDVLRAATINNAVAFGVQDDYGTVESGKVANLLLLGSDPLQSVAAYNDIRYVVVDGAIHQRSEFSAKGGGY